MPRRQLSTGEYRESILERYGNPHNVMVMPDAYRGARSSLKYFCPIHGLQSTPTAGTWRGKCKRCSREEVAETQRYTREDAQRIIDEYFGRRKLVVLSDPGLFACGRRDRRMRFELRCLDHPYAPTFTRLLHKITAGLADCPLCASERLHHRALRRLGMSDEAARIVVGVRRDKKHRKIILTQGM